MSRDMEVTPPTVQLKFQYCYAYLMTAYEDDMLPSFCRSGNILWIKVTETAGYSTCYHLALPNSESRSSSSMSAGVVENLKNTQISFLKNILVSTTGKHSRRFWLNYIHALLELVCLQLWPINTRFQFAANPRRPVRC